MPIPTQTEMFLYVLKLMEDGGSYTRRQISSDLEFIYALPKNNNMQGYTGTMIDGYPAIVANTKSTDGSLAKPLSEWNSMKVKLETKEIAPDGYAEWKRTYEGASKVNTKDGKISWIVK